MTSSALRNALTASAQTAVVTAAGLAYFGYLMRAVGPEALGGWLAWLAIGMVACLADLGLRDALVRQVALCRDDRVRAAEQIDTALISVGVSMALALGVMMGLVPRVLDLGEGARRAGPGIVFGVAAMIWLQRIADLHAGALEGMQAYADVARNNIVGALAGLALLVAAVPWLGVDAASLGLIVQYGVSGAAHAWVLRRRLPGRSGLPYRWRPRLFRDSLRFGLAVQGTVGTFLLIETATKLMLARGDALALVSYYDLALRIARGLRNLLVAGNRVLVPRLAQAHADSERERQAGQAPAAALELRNVYLRSFHLMQFLALPIFVACAASAGLVSLATRGQVDERMVLCFFLTLPGWYVLCVTDPVINVTLGTGRMRPTVLAHGAMLVLMALAGALHALRPGPPEPDAAGLATVAAASVAVILPCLWLVWRHQRDQGLPLRTLHPLRSTAVTLFGAVCAIGVARLDANYAAQGLGLLLTAVLVGVSLRWLPAWPWVRLQWRRRVAGR